ncbi:hypothetical protein QTP88_017650 [Uroleucon formosanum]
MVTAVGSGVSILLTIEALANCLRWMSSVLIHLTALPSLSCNAFHRLQTEVGYILKNSAFDEMKKAGDEERKMAIECRNVDSDGIPMCTVVADGQWSKRSYKTKYDALSGVATIIGLKTQKVLFVGIRNKYCIICQKYNSKNEKVPEHECFLNWAKPSTAMEADGVLEGFTKSIEMHGDGDSSVTKKLNELSPYGPTFSIKKIECVNHLLRNYGSKLTTLARITKYPIRIRKHILTNIFRFRGDVIEAVKHWKNAVGLSKLEKLKEIRKDLLNGPYHRLGQHDNCNEYFCDQLTSNNINLVPEAESLLENKNNNICEQFNAIINKHVAGKRINFSNRGNYNTRVHAAVISFNSKEYLRCIHKKISNFSPGSSSRRQLFPKKNKNKKPVSNGPDADYRMSEPLSVDFSPEEIEDKKKIFLARLENVNFTQIEIDTREQTDSQLWYQERKIRLTASSFNQICKIRPNTS